MVRDNTSKDLPPEVRQFKLPPDGKAANGWTGPQSTNAAREPTAEELAFYRNMTQEEWEARQAGWKANEAATDASAEKKRAAEQKEWEDRQREKWSRKTRALQTMRPTGDPLQDAQRFFEAIGFSPNSLDIPDREAYENGDRAGMLRYFKEVQRIGAGLPGGRSEWTREYFAMFNKVVQEIINAAELTKWKS